jgi:hypothetical protein
MEPSNARNLPGPCRMADCVRAAADSWAAPASWAVMHPKPILRVAAVGRVGLPLGSLRHTDGA